MLISFTNYPLQTNTVVISYFNRNLVSKETQFQNLEQTTRNFQNVVACVTANNLLQTSQIEFPRHNIHTLKDQGPVVQS